MECGHENDECAESVQQLSFAELTKQRLAGRPLVAVHLSQSRALFTGCPIAHDDDLQSTESPAHTHRALVPGMSVDVHLPDIWWLWANVVSPYFARRFFGRIKVKEEKKEEKNRKQAAGARRRIKNSPVWETKANYMTIGSLSRDWPLCTHLAEVVNVATFPCVPSAQAKAGVGEEEKQIVLLRPARSYALLELRFQYALHRIASHRTAPHCAMCIDFNN